MGILPRPLPPAGILLASPAFITLILRGPVGILGCQGCLAVGTIGAAAGAAGVEWALVGWAL